MKPFLTALLIFAGVLIFSGHANSAAAPIEELPAASPAGLVADLVPERFANPQFGPAIECRRTERQFIVLNPTIVEGEPVYLRLLVTSLLPQEKVEFMAQLSFGTDLRVMVQPPRGRTYEFRGFDLGSVVPTAVVEFEGFKQFRTDLRLAMDAESLSGAAFDMPGTYRLHVSLKCLEGRAVGEDQPAGVFEIEVLPANGDNAQALDILDDYTIFEAFQANNSTLGNRSLVDGPKARMLSRVIAEAPDAALRPHAMIVLADYHDQQGDSEAALDLLRRVREEYPHTPMAQESLFREINFHLARGDRATARAAFLQAWQDPAFTQSIYPKSGLWKLFAEDFVNRKVGTQWMIQEDPGPDPQFLDPEYVGPRIIVSEEVQREWGLPAEIFPGLME